MVVTTNLAFSEWPKVFADDEKLTTALLNRLADRATIITTRGKSFRMRRSKGAPEQTAEPKGAASGRCAPSGGRRRPDVGLTLLGEEAVASSAQLGVG